MKYQRFFHFLQNAGKDPEALSFVDELTQLKNRRFLLNHFRHAIAWDEIQSRSVSLLMIDIDYFKYLNEQYGQEAGDQALIHISGILRESLPPDGIAVRYAGDEFVVLLPDTPKKEAQAIAEKILNQIHYNLFFSAEADTPIPLTLSIGIATAPEDAETGKGLIHQADTALYGAKQSGKNQWVDAASVIPEAVSFKTAIHYLDSAGIVGRKSQFEMVGKALKDLGRGQRGFLIIDGAPGMGKTSFLELVQRNLEKKNVNLVHVSGTLQESYRPYYLISYVAMALMRKLPDKGQSVLDALDEPAINRLAHIMPQLIGSKNPMPEDNPAHREAIFRSFTDFFTALMDKRPMVLLIDDMDYSDPASLHLLETLFKNQTVPILICGTASEELPGRPQAIPLELFRNAYSERLGIKKIALTGLTAEGIDKHVRMVFPGIDMARKTAKELASITGGNPLFIVAVLRKMVDDGKIYQQGPEWRIARLERNYFPSSLEEIIQQKKSLLDKESRQFLDGASAMGETMSLSMLAGFSKERSTKIYDYLNEAAAHGLLRSEFTDADENIRFSSKRVRDAIYQDIPPEIKEQLQERVGNYKEDLYKRDLLPSASIVAHHFKYSADLEKARQYEKFETDYHHRLFDPEEARNYTETEPGGETRGEPAAGDAIASKPLSPEGMKQVPTMLRLLTIAIRNAGLYPRQSKTVTDAVKQVFAAIETILSSDERISIIFDKNSLLINQQAIDTTAYPKVAETILEIWGRLELHHLTFLRGLRINELTALIHKISRTRRQSVPPGFWQEFQKNTPMPHVAVGQIRYEKLPSASPPESDSPETAADAPGAAPALSQSDAVILNDTEQQTLYEIISSFLGALSKLKLYPPGGPVAQKSVDSLHAALQAFLSRYPVLTIARVENTLLVNGVKMDVTGFETLARGLIRFFRDTGLDSLTVFSGVEPAELSDFLVLAGQSEEKKMDTGAWEEAAAARDITHIRVNQGLYGIKDILPGTLSLESENAEANDAAGSLMEGEIDMDQLPGRIRDLFLTGAREKARELLTRLQKKYNNAEDSDKGRILELFDVMLAPPDWKPGAPFIQFVLTPLLEIFEMESRTHLVDQAAALGYRAATDLIGFGEYSLAAWVLTRIKDHPKSHLIRPPEMPPTVLENLVAGLADQNRELQQAAYQLLSSMGSPVRPYLLNMIKSDSHIQSRRLAAELIKHQGEEGAAALKRALMNENMPEARARILDVIDGVTTDVKKELAYALSDFTEEVRLAGGRLAERLDSPEIVRLLIELAQRETTDTVITAVNTLGRLKAIDAADTMIQLLAQSEEEDLLVAICRAMGQIADPSFILPLQNILRSSRNLFFKKTRPSQVRVAAAYAIHQINDPRSRKILKALANDADPRLQEVARNLAL